MKPWTADGILDHGSRILPVTTVIFQDNYNSFLYFIDINTGTVHNYPPLPISKLKNFPDFLAFFFVQLHAAALQLISDYWPNSTLVSHWSAIIGLTLSWSLIGQRLLAQIPAVISLVSDYLPNSSCSITKKRLIGPTLICPLIGQCCLLISSIMKGSTVSGLI